MKLSASADEPKCISQSPAEHRRIDCRRHKPISREYERFETDDIQEKSGKMSFKISMAI
jgi:hypothetical protein